MEGGSFVLGLTSSRARRTLMAPHTPSLPPRRRIPSMFPLGGLCALCVSALLSLLSAVLSLQRGTPYTTLKIRRVLRSPARAARGARYPNTCLSRQPSTAPAAAARLGSAETLWGSDLRMCKAVVGSDGLNTLPYGNICNCKLS